MERCPFWSSNNKLETCDKECPMSKSEEGCIFQLFYLDSLISDEKED
ncbi:hypothetical protein [uncultured Clostridium sp.]|jgi:hypothetical protein|nr:hypothetical protein [uncultured Clostridium sp.]